MLIQKFSDLDSEGTGLDNKERVKIIEVLNRNLSNGVLLTIKYKKYHWTVSGPSFRELHLLFDDHATNINATVDELAERIMTLGGVTCGSPQEFIQHGTITSAEPGINTPDAMLKDLLNDHKNVILQLRKDIELTSLCGDPGTADLFTRIVQVHEKDAWFVREHLKNVDIYKK